MKLLLDACVWGGAVAELLAAGYEVQWVGEWPSDPGVGEILARAQSEQRVLITLDKDFGELAVLHGMAHRGILRLVSVSARRQAALTVEVLSQHGDELQAGAIITAEPGRLRIRSPNHEQ